MNQKNILEIISLILKHYSKYFKKYDILKESNKIDVCKFIDNFIEKEKLMKN